MISNDDTNKIFMALVQIGYSRTPTPESEKVIELQCNWCLTTVREPKNSKTIKTIKSRAKHSADCPVLLAQSLLNNSTHK